MFITTEVERSVTDGLRFELVRVYVLTKEEEPLPSESPDIFTGWSFIWTMVKIQIENKKMSSR